MLSFEEAKARLENAGQSHVLQFWAELSAEERGTILEEISQLQPEELLEHCRAAAAAASRHSSADGRLDERMEPVPPEFIGSVRKSNKETLQMWGDEGNATGACLGSNVQNNILLQCVHKEHNIYCTLRKILIFFRVIADFTGESGCIAVSWWSGDSTWCVISQGHVQCWTSK